MDRYVFSIHFLLRKQKEPVKNGFISVFNWFSLGWGGRIRTHEMEESESSALPLGDTPI